MIKTTTINLSIPRNTSRAYEVIFTEDGVAQDITDWTVYFTAKTNMKDDDDDAVIKKDLTGFADATSGKALIEITTTDTSIDAGTYWYDIKYKDDENNAGILYTGKLTITYPVTQRG